MNALSNKVVAEVMENPEISTAYSWTKLPPTLSRHLNFSAPERSAIGICKDTKAVGDEVPVTLRYAEAKVSKNRTCKLICAAVFSSLASKDIRTFEEASAQKWEKLAMEARAKA